MSFWSDFGKGVSTHVKAWGFIAEHKLWLYFLYPVVLVLLLYIFGFYSAFGLGNYLSGLIIDWITPDKFDTGYGWLDGLLACVSWIVRFALGFIIKAFFFAILIKYIRYIVLILCSPMMALLSERVDEIMTGNKYPFVFSQFIKDMFRGMGVAIRNMLFELLFILGCFIIGWIPVIGWFTVPFLWIVGWYFLGFNMMDYTYERKRLRISEGARFTRRHKGIAIGNGMIFSFLLIIPFAGMIIAPVLSSVAGTLATMEMMDEEKSRAAQPKFQQ